MARWRGGSSPPPGCYFAPGSRTIEVVDNRAQTLSGSAETRYVRVPPFLAPLLAAGSAVAGALFVLCFPILFFVLLPYYLVRALIAAGRCLVAALRRDPTHPQAAARADGRRPN